VPAGWREGHTPLGLGGTAGAALDRFVGVVGSKTAGPATTILSYVNAVTVNAYRNIRWRRSAKMGGVA